MIDNRRLAVLGAVTVTGALLAVPVAEAAPSTGTVGSAAVSHTCVFKAYGEKLRIKVGANLGSNGRDIEAVSLRATDNDEAGIYDNNDVRIKKVRLTIRDEDGVVQLSNTVSPSSPGSYDVGPAGEGAGKLTVKVRWRTHAHTVTASCSKVID